MFEIFFILYTSLTSFFCQLYIYFINHIPLILMKKYTNKWVIESMKDKNIYLKIFLKLKLFLLCSKYVYNKTKEVMHIYKFNAYL